jgi:hypothetical protein
MQVRLKINSCTTKQKQKHVPTESVTPLLIFSTCCVMKIITSRAGNEVSRPRVQWLVFSICRVLSYYNDSENAKISKLGTAGKGKHTTLRFECGES